MLLCYIFSMRKKIVLLVIIAVLAVGILLVLRGGQKSSLSSPSISILTKEVKPSETFIEYSDPSGFSFSYPDNLSLTKNDVDERAYADLLLSSKEVNGSLNLKISDSKFKTLDEWAKLNKGVTKEVKLGNLEALEIKTSDRLLLGALDQEIFFSIEIPLIEEDFWMKVYSKLLSDFSFVTPDTGVSEGSTTSSEDIIFAGEEVVE